MGTQATTKVKENSFDKGKEIKLLFSEKQILYTRDVELKKYNKETQTYEPLYKADGSVKMGTEKAIALPRSSQYQNHVLTTTASLGTPHSYKKNPETGKSEDMGLLSHMKFISVYENATYKLTHTPHMLDSSGVPMYNEYGGKIFDYENQTTVKITGKELKQEFESWKEQTQQKGIEEAIKGTSKVYSHTPTNAKDIKGQKKENMER